MQIGKRLLPFLVDDTARTHPRRRFGIIPKGHAVSDGFTEVTFETLARGVNALSWWIEEHIGKAEGKETVAYIGGNDVRYIVFMLACQKTGYTPLLPSTRLSDAAYNHILNATNCTKMCFSTEKQRRIQEIKQFRPELALFEVPATVNLFEGPLGLRPYPFTKSYEALEDEVAFIIHSSGTTGMPKPVPLTHGFLGTWDYAPHIIPPGRQSSFYNNLNSSSLLLTVTPNFHLMGLLTFFASIFHAIPVLTCPDLPLSVELLVETIRAAKPSVAMLPPSILEDMSRSETALECLGTLDFVCFSGAPLAPETGETLRKYTKLRTMLGSSEMCVVSSLAPKDEADWAYFEWNPGYGIDMQHVGDGFYELVIPRQQTRNIHGVFHTFPHLTEYHSKDLFVQHPKNPELWRYHGRLDDVIVLSNGEKLNPVTLEKIIEGHPLVSRAVLIGQSRFQSALLIQPDWKECGEIDEKKFIDDIWPLVEKANEAVPNYGRVVRSYIRLASRDKPFKLTAKGTTQRRTVNSDYAKEIDAIYATSAEETDLPASIDLASITLWVRDIIVGLLGRPDIANSEDFYAAGLDSLQTVRLAKILTTALSRSDAQASISQQQIYARPSIDQLAAHLLKVLNGYEITSVSRTEKIANLVAKYTKDLPIQIQGPPAPPRKHLTVVLTGSTGSLGTYLLHTLLNDQAISKIYCLNRSDALAKQTTSFREKGLDTSALTDKTKVEFLTVSFGERHFALDAKTYNTLLASVNLIIHNAWKVNFNHPVESFENPHIKGVREFVDFSLQSRYRAHIAFVSSVSTIGSWTADMGPSVPEIPIETPEVVLEQGYGESKHVAERICLEASRQSLVPTSILRVGQIAGPTTKLGLWNPNEWAPILVKTSKSMGKVPDSLGSYVIDWIPVDTLAKTTLEILKTRLATQSTSPSNTNAVFHLTNPSRTTWSTLIPAIQAKYPVSPVPLSAWLADLERICSPSEQDLEDKPALKLLPFFRGLAEGTSMGADVSVEKAKGASRTMATMGPISGALMENWLGQWVF